MDNNRATPLLHKKNAFRNDIQGIRALAVFAVIIYHMGFLPDGYLGVDIFLVISGYLITGIMYNDLNNNRYSVKDFYIRRFRRIVPLVLTVGLIALILGVLLMLPDDLENLAQSIIATNFFSNNVLQYITTGNYWNVINEYKPMLHTWSLGVEEHFYIVYPLLFLLLLKRKNLIFYVVLATTILSAVLYVYATNEAFKFYMLPTRFFEISVGGLAALRIHKIKPNHLFATISFVLMLTMLVGFISIPADLKVFITVLSTVGLIVFNKTTSLVNHFLENKVIVYFGTISFSLYMWHQVILAFYRYAYSQEIQIFNSIVIILIVIALSVVSYHFVENYFRHQKNLSNQKLFMGLSVLFIIVNGFALFLYVKAGTIKDVPELGIYANRAERGMHGKYNDLIYKLSGDFADSDKTHVLIIGNSFARDWANILLASNYRSNIEITYSFNPYDTPNLQKKLDIADVIFCSAYTKEEFRALKSKFNIDEQKVWITGAKNFGRNAGVFYNAKRDRNYCMQKANVEAAILRENIDLRNQWGSRYIDLLSFIMDDEDKVPVFGDDCKFISQDGYHLTKSGAEFFASKLDLSVYFDEKRIALNKISPSLQIPIVKKVNTALQLN